MTPRALINIIVRNQVYLERLKAGRSRAFVKVITKLNKEITGILSALEVTSISDLTQAKLVQLLSNLRKVQQGVIAAQLDEFMVDLDKLAEYYAGFEGRAIQQVVRDITLAVPTAEVAMAYDLKRPLAATGELLEPFLAGWSTQQVRAVEGVIRRAHAEGWTGQQAMQAIRGTKAQKFNDGILAISKRKAEALVRTSMQHVAASTRSVTWAKNQDIIRGYRWVSTLDGRTSTQCRSLDGQTFELGKGPMPPLHVNCRSSTAADLDPALDFLDVGATRSAEFGPVGAKTTYYGWLKQQPAAYQDSVLGATRGKLLRNGGLSAEEFARLNLGRNFEPLTLEEMRRLEPTTFEKANI